jgi:hypothetical protein
MGSVPPPAWVKPQQITTGPIASIANPDVPYQAPQQTPPQLWAAKLPIVVMASLAMVVVALSPWPRFQVLIWFLNFFAAWFAVQSWGQCVRMFSAAFKMRAALFGSHGSSTPASSSGSPSSSGSSTPIVQHRHTNSGSSLKMHLRGKSAGRSIGSDSELHDQDGEAVVLVTAPEWSSVDWCVASHLPEPKWHHVFVIPNYKEEMDTLTATLDQLASHPWATSYTILLAMEAKEAGAARKAQHLVKAYSHCFQVSVAAFGSCWGGGVGGDTKARVHACKWHCSPC